MKLKIMFESDKNKNETRKTQCFEISKMTSASARRENGD
jgi:hypothetical protein